MRTVIQDSTSDEGFCFKGRIMKISEKQLQLLIQLLADTVRIDISGIFSLDYETRHKLYQQIMNQQNNELKEVE